MTEKIKHIAYIVTSKAITFAICIDKGFVVRVILRQSMYGVLQLLNIVKVILGLSSMSFKAA